MGRNGPHPAAGLSLVLAGFLATLNPPVAAGEARHRTNLRFEVTAAAGLLAVPRDGRMLVMVNPAGEPEPRLWVGEAGRSAPPVLGRDIAQFGTGVVAALDERSAIFPIDHLADIEPGDYFVQALFTCNEDLRTLTAPGNLYSPVRNVRVDPSQGGVIRLEVSERTDEDELPKDNGPVRFVKLRSELLSRFHGRPMFLRAGIILPRDYDREPERRWPLRVQVGGFGGRYGYVRNMMREGADYRSAWEAPDVPQMVVLHLDGAGPNGDPYQVNSDNNGPYGDAAIRELIPYVERQFRCTGQPSGRFVTGHSTGGWVSLALQVFYPDFFGGCWSFSPDSVDFRAMQLVDLFHDANAYIDEEGFERPAARTTEDEPRYSMRHECHMENVIGSGDSWANSGAQWGSWNAVYGRRGADGRPIPAWDPRTGRINPAAAESWRRYDLRQVMADRWPSLGPRLQGKIHIWVGEMDNYYLNHAVHLLDGFFSQCDPPARARVTFGPGRSHRWMGLTEPELMKEMGAAAGAK